MFHLLLTVCTGDGLCAERWLPAADAAASAACIAAAPPLAGSWSAAHGLTPRAFRCVPTAALPSLALVPVAEGVWVHRGADAAAAPENGGGIANLGVIEAPQAVIVVDPGGSRGEGERLLAAIRQRTEKPVAAAILTHVHPDHILGAEPFREAGVPIIAHSRLAEALGTRAEAYSTIYAASIGPAAWLGSGFVLPDETVAAPERREMGGAHLALVPVGPAHSDSDLTVLHEESGTLFAGDLAFRRLTPVLDGSLRGWLAWLAAPPEPVPRLVVPGHGPVAADWQEATGATRAYLEALAAAVRDALAAGTGLSEAVPRVTAAMAREAGDLADFADTTRRNAATAYHELEWE